MCVSVVLNERKQTKCLNNKNPIKFYVIKLMLDMVESVL